MANLTTQSHLEEAYGLDHISNHGFTRHYSISIGHKTKGHGRQAAGPPGCRAAGSQGRKPAGLQGCMATRPQGCKAAGFMHLAKPQPPRPAKKMAEKGRRVGKSELTTRHKQVRHVSDTGRLAHTFSCACACVQDCLAHLLARSPLAGTWPHTVDGTQRAALAPAPGQLMSGSSMTGRAS